MGAHAPGVATRADANRYRSPPLLTHIAEQAGKMPLRVWYGLAVVVAVGLLLAILPVVMERTKADREAVLAEGLARSEFLLGIVAGELGRIGGAAALSASDLDAAARRIPVGLMKLGVFSAARSRRSYLDDPHPAVLMPGAGPMRVRLRDGAEAIVGIRPLPGGARLAIVQPAEALLRSVRPWGAAHTGLCFAVAICLLSGAAVAALASCVASTRRARDQLARRVDTSLGRARCGLWDWDLARGAVTWSSSMFELLGYEPRSSPISFAEVNDLIHPEDRDLGRLTEGQGAEPARPIDHEFRVRSSQGAWRWLRIRSEMVIEPEDGTRHLVGIAVDVTDERCSAEREATADVRLRDALEAVSEAFVLWDAENRLVLCNSKFRSFHDLDPGMAVAGATYAEIIRGSRPPLVASQAVRENPAEPGSRTLEAQLADGRWLQINERRTRDGGYVSVGTDITALKRHEADLLDSKSRLLRTVRDLTRSREVLRSQAVRLSELADLHEEQKVAAEAANHAKTEFLGKMSHELRTPLNAVIGFAEVMGHEMFGPLGCERYRDYVRGIHASGMRLLGMVEDILQMSRLESGRFGLATGPVSPDEVVAGALADVAEDAAAKSVTVLAEAGRHAPIEADGRSLRQAVRNILDNSVKFARPGTSVRIRAVRVADVLNIFVVDDGPGIPLAFLPRLGRPFEQPEPESTRACRGAGLGIALARAIVEMHGGGLRIRSREGTGTAVLLRVPARQAAANDEAASDRPPVRHLQAAE